MQSLISKSRTSTENVKEPNVCKIISRRGKGMFQPNKKKRRNVKQKSDRWKLRLDSCQSHAYPMAYLLLSTTTQWFKSNTCRYTHIMCEYCYMLASNAHIQSIEHCALQIRLTILQYFLASQRTTTSNTFT